MHRAQPKVNRIAIGPEDMDRLSTDETCNRQASVLFYRFPTADNKQRCWPDSGSLVEDLAAVCLEADKRQDSCIRQLPRRAKNQIYLTFPETLFEVLIKFRMEAFY